MGDAKMGEVVLAAGAKADARVGVQGRGHGCDMMGLTDGTGSVGF